MIRRIVGYDAGHGHPNHGTRHVASGLYEPKLMLEAVHMAAAKLSTSELIEPIIIRQMDSDLTPHERNGIAERAGCEAVVSCHLNWSDTDPTRWGGEVYHKRGDQIGKDLGVNILGHIPGRDWRTWVADSRAPGSLVVAGAYSMWCALVEFGFLSNRHDRNWLLQSDTLEEIAMALFLGTEAWAKQLNQEITACSL